MTGQAEQKARMMRLIHLSDLHFGTNAPELTLLLQKTIDELSPDMVIISGDFTQTAVASEFAEARAFLDALKFPWFSIPGNHDISRYDMFERFTNPYKSYRRWISKDIQPVFHGKGVCVAGINTARRIVPHWNWAHGAISKDQTEWLAAQYATQPDAVKVCVMHHPVWRAVEMQLHTIVFGGREALEALKRMKVNLVLSGHVHHAAVLTMPVDEKSKIVFVSASTALSSRLRGQKNGFNIIDIYPDRMAIEVRGFLDGKFDKLESYEHMMN